MKVFLKYLDKSAMERITEEVLQYTKTGKIDDHWDVYLEKIDEQYQYGYKEILEYCTTIDLSIGLLRNYQDIKFQDILTEKNPSMKYILENTNLSEVVCLSVDIERGEKKQDIDLSYLDVFDNLVALEIVNTNLEKIELPKNVFKKLRRLNLNYNKLKDIDLDQITTNKILDLCLMGNETEYIDTEPLSKLTNMSYLSISTNNISQLDLSNINRHINFLEIGTSSKREGRMNIRQLEKYKHMTVLVLHGKKVSSEQDLQTLSDLQHRVIILSDLQHRVNIFNDEKINYKEIRPKRWKMKGAGFNHMMVKWHDKIDPNRGDHETLMW